MQLPQVIIPALSLFEEINLWAIVYKETVSTDYILTWSQKRATYQHAFSKMHIMVMEQTIHFSGRIPHQPFFYPPPLKHKPGFQFVTKQPVFFPPGLHNYLTIG
jgi:hypothetical protein